MAGWLVLYVWIYVPTPHSVISLTDEPPIEQLTNRLSASALPPNPTTIVDGNIFATSRGIFVQQGTWCYTPEHALVQRNCADVASEQP